MVELSIFGNMPKLLAQTAHSVRGDDDDSAGDATASKLKHCTATLLRTLGFAVPGAADDDADDTEGPQAAAAAAAPADAAGDDDDDEQNEEDMAIICQVRAFPPVSPPFLSSHQLL